MDVSVPILLILFSYLSASSASAGERLHEQIYSSIEGGGACFRRLNGTHQAGCSSSNKGSVGVVHMIDDVSDAKWLAFNATAGPYVAVLSTSKLHDFIELLMEHHYNVAGILLYDNVTESAKVFTQESRCPNEYSSGPGSQCSSSQAGGIVWNDKGSGLLRKDIPFPIYYLPKSKSEEIVKIRNCSNKFNLDRDNQMGRPLCSLQLHAFMFAAVNTEVCLRRSASTTFLTATKVCDPLGDHNVYYSLFPRAKENATSRKSVTFVTARIDTASLFDGLSPGAASSVTGMVTLIAAASTLAKMIPVADADQYKNNILWTLFNGEAFDYIGSQRVAYDLSRKSWPPASPLDVSQMKLHVEIGQIGGSFLNNKDNVSWPLHAYAPYTTPPPAITEFLAELSTNMNKNKMTVTPTFTTNLPPSSLHSFRRILRNVTENGDLSQVVLVDHEQTFSNMFYHSVLDDYENIGYFYKNLTIDSNGTFVETSTLLENGTMKEGDVQVKIARLASALSSTLYQTVVGAPYSGNLTTSAHLIDELLHCMLQSQACQLLLAADYASSSDEPPNKPPTLYVSVASWSGSAAVFAGHLLALLTGTHLSANETSCSARKDPNFSYYWLRGWNHKGVCIETTMNFTQAVSPAFIIPDYDYSSGEYSTWTESVWAVMWARVFVTAGGESARVAVVAGSVSTVLTLILTYWLRKHSQLIFVDTTNSVVNRDAASGILRSVNC